MKRNGWHISQEADRYVLARIWPPRLDVAAMSDFPPVRPDLLARQVRQDLWRLLKTLRGFSPVIIVDATEGRFSLTAGGRLESRAPAGLQNRIQALLDSEAHRKRWLAWARGRTA